MPNSSPPWVRTVQVAVTVENIPIVPEAATEYPIDSYGYYSGASGTYQTVKEWTVTADRIGILRSIEVAASDYTFPVWKLVVAGVTVFEDVILPDSFTKEWPDVQLTAGQQVILSVKGNGATALVAYCDFNGKEVG